MELSLIVFIKSLFSTRSNLGTFKELLEDLTFSSYEFSILILLVMALHNS